MSLRSQKQSVRRVPGKNSPQAPVAVVLQGSSRGFVLGMLFTLFLSAGIYLFSVNRNAVQGYHLRSLEKEIGTLEEKNAELRISEADLRSFYRINATKEELNMQKTETLKYLEAHEETVALR